MICPIINENGSATHINTWYYSISRRYTNFFSVFKCLFRFCGSFKFRIYIRAIHILSLYGTFRLFFKKKGLQPQPVNDFVEKNCVFAQGKHHTDKYKPILNNLNNLRISTFPFTLFVCFFLSVNIPPFFQTVLWIVCESDFLISNRVYISPYLLARFFHVAKFNPLRTR